MDPPHTENNMTTALAVSPLANVAKLTTFCGGVFLSLNPVAFSRGVAQAADGTNARLECEECGDNMATDPHVKCVCYPERELVCGCGHYYDLSARDAAGERV
jgi:hypothetical protein